MNHYHYYELKFWLINIAAFSFSFAPAEKLLRILILVSILIYNILKIKNEKSKKHQDDDEK